MLRTAVPDREFLIRTGPCGQVNGSPDGAARLSDELWAELSQAFDLDGS